MESVSRLDAEVSTLASRVVIPDVHHLGLVGHYAGVLANGVDTWVYKLEKTLVS